MSKLGGDSIMTPIFFIVSQMSTSKPFYDLVLIILTFLSIFESHLNQTLNDIVIAVIKCSEEEKNTLPRGSCITLLTNIQDIGDLRDGATSVPKMSLVCR